MKKQAGPLKRLLNLKKSITNNQAQLSIEYEGKIAMSEFINRW
jgi:hypothetical protein